LANGADSFTCIQIDCAVIRLRAIAEHISAVKQVAVTNVKVGGNQYTYETYASNMSVQES
jgi:hypothetical protein